MYSNSSNEQIKNKLRGKSKFILCREHTFIKIDVLIHLLFFRNLIN